MRSTGEKSPTYGDGVLAETYAWGLEIHQYIPQADQGIVDTLEVLVLEKKKGPFRILDLGMGPGRLTPRFAAIPGTEVIGIDNSKPFVGAAKRADKRGSARYVLADFLEYEPDQQFDVIVMQGVYHHVHGGARKLWLEKMHQLLAPGGTVVVGDEFIPEYETEDERRARAGLFYLHIIGEALKARARKGSEQDLAKEECINFIADVLNGEEFCGYYDGRTLERIQEEAADINGRLFVLGGFGGKATRKKRINGAVASRRVNELIGWVRMRAHALKESGAAKLIDRGDYKVSIPMLETEFSGLFSSIKGAERQFGPVDNIGGMAVLSFLKNKTPAR